MAYCVRLFIDFWNFQLTWNQRVPGETRCDWPKVPTVFIERSAQALASAGVQEALQLEETRVYASYDPAARADAKLREWLMSFLNRLPSFRVFAKERVPVQRPVYCRACDSEIADCPVCKKPLRFSREKGVDTAIVTDLLSLAWERAYDVAILVTSDADMIPCVERIQEKGFKVINAAWTGRGNDLAQASWASFLIDRVVGDLSR